MGAEKERLMSKPRLYYSTLVSWRKTSKRARTTSNAGPKTKDPRVLEIARLQRENVRLQKKLRKAELMIDLQKKCLGYWGSHCRQSRTPTTNSRTIDDCCTKRKPGSRSALRLSRAAGVTDNDLWPTSRTRSARTAVPAQASSARAKS